MSISIRSDIKPGAPLKGENPLPYFRSREHNEQYTAYSPTMEEKHLKLAGYECVQRVLPYRIQDRYSRNRTPMSIKTIVLENENLRAEFYPEYGGRLTSLFDKKRNRELVHNNPVFQPGNLAIRDAWISTGIEFNCSQRGHHFLTCSPLFAALCKDDNGEEFLRMYEYERCKGVYYQMDFHLPAGAEFLYMYVRIINPDKEPVSTYWWTNIDLPEREGVRVFSATDEVIYYMSPEQMSAYPEGASNMAVGHLPYLDALPGVDISYPRNYPFATDYFFQMPETEEMPWEAAAYDDGLVFYEASTKALCANKMFCWGLSEGGQKWRDFLANPGEGDFFEIQAGIAPTQNHGLILQSESTIDFVQAFGCSETQPNLLQEEDWAAGQHMISELIHQRITADDLNSLLEKYRVLAQKEPEEFLHNGSGFGALEKIRKEKSGVPAEIKGLVFPMNTIGTNQLPWLSLLLENRFPEADPKNIPFDYITQPSWLNIMEAAIDAPENQHWNTYLHYGIMIAEAGDFDKARQCFIKSLEYKDNVWARRNLARLYFMDNDIPKASDQYELLFRLPEAFEDQSFSQEYIAFLNEVKEYSTAWEFFCNLPEKLKNDDRICIDSAFSAVNCNLLDYVESLFTREFAVIREGEQSTTELWYLWKAHKEAMTMGVSYTDELLEEIKSRFNPPASIDFRMDAALDKK